MTPLSNSDTSDTPSSSSSTSPNSHSSLQTNEDAIRKKLERDANAPTSCVVCSSPAGCYHYQAPVCNACKTYFRRCMLLRKNYQCKLNAKCDIKNGAKCKACRYDRCLIVGMNVKSITFKDTETANAVLNDVNKRKRDLKARICGEDDRALAVQVKFRPKFDQTSHSRAVDFLAYLEVKFKTLRESNINDAIFYDMDICDLMKRRCELGNADKYEKMPIDQSPIIFEPPTFDKKEKPRHWLAFDLFLNMEYLKVLPFFQLLDYKDQEALLVHTIFVNTIICQNWYSYKQNSQILVHPDGKGPLHIRKFVPISKIFPEVMPIELENFSRPIDPFYRVEPTDEEYFLLKAIIFCHSGSPGLSEHAKRILEKERDMYASTLLRRIQARLGTIQGAKKYAEIIGLIESYFSFAQKRREFHVFIMSMMPQEHGKPHKDPQIIDYFVTNSSNFD